MERTRLDSITAALADSTSRRTALRRGSLVTALLTAVSLDRSSTAAQATPTPGSPKGTSLTGQFRATVYQGPDKGLALAGTLQVTGNVQGQLTGQLTPTTGAAVPVSGQLTGAAITNGQLTGGAINLVFYLPNDQAIIGVGTIGLHPISKRWVVGGPLVGPKPGDSGDWDFCLHCYQNDDSRPVCVEIKCPPETS